MGIAIHTSRTIEAFRGLTSAPQRSPEPASAEAVPGDRVELSAAGRQQGAQRAAAPTAAEPGQAPAAPTTPSSVNELDATAQRVLQELRQRDTEVRLHEQAHLLAAGRFATGGPQYTYETGPDGRRYAVGGEVPIDLSAVPGDPEATVRKAQTLRRAALAPADPSGPDLAVAAQATALAAQAQQELRKLQSSETAPGAAAAAGVTPQDERRTAVTPGRHVCGPNCQEHDTRPAAEGSSPISAGVVAAGLLASKAVASYRLASRGPAETAR
ncbi:MAG: putative metalloprotease CJM1_0395 family protein [Candidatus Tectimicrobiota bacterium]